MKQFKCQKCTYKWTPRLKKPDKCPKCKSPYWNKPKPLKFPKTKPEVVIRKAGYLEVIMAIENPEIYAKENPEREKYLSIYQKKKTQTNLAKLLGKRQGTIGYYFRLLEKEDFKLKGYSINWNTVFEALMSHLENTLKENYKEADLRLRTIKKSTSKKPFSFEGLYIAEQKVLPADMNKFKNKIQKIKEAPERLIAMLKYFLMNKYYPSQKPNMLFLFDKFIRSLAAEDKIYIMSRDLSDAANSVIEFWELAREYVGSFDLYDFLLYHNWYPIYDGLERLSKRAKS